MPNGPPKVLALIPAYNASRTIREVLSQIPCPPVDEIAVLDDGSSDNTTEIVTSLPRTILLRHAQNKGYGGAQKNLHQSRTSCLG